ncbi:MAG: prepilin peptidase [Chloroflexota bacterium]
MRGRLLLRTVAPAGCLLGIMAWPQPEASALAAAALGLAGALVGWVLPVWARWLVARWRLPLTRGEPPRWHSAALAACVAAFFGRAGYESSLQWPLAPTLGALTWLGLVAAVDLQTKLIPNRLTYPALLAAPAFVALLPGASPVAHLLGGIAGGTLFGLAFLTHPRGMGLGDVKLAIVLGLYLGIERGLVALTSGVLLGGLAALGLLLAGRERMAPFPYGPALAAGAALTLLVGT